MRVRMLRCPAWFSVKGALPCDTRVCVSSFGSIVLEEKIFFSQNECAVWGGGDVNFAYNRKDKCMCTFNSAVRVKVWSFGVQGFQRSLSDCLLQDDTHRCVLQFAVVIDYICDSLEVIALLCWVEIIRILLVAHACMECISFFSPFFWRLKLYVHAAVKRKTCATRGFLCVRSWKVTPMLLLMNCQYLRSECCVVDVISRSSPNSCIMKII